ncbi:hypothetical protein JXA12_05695 [Candidatus Woesearchaeota archaeon]|nr:hypothetical protein [Candidatus Woesearchaeota archaeon]
MLLSLVSGIGISPGRYEVDFSPWLEQEFSFVIINNEGQDYTVGIGVGGDLAEHVTLSDQEVFVKGGSMAPFTARLELPAAIETPGRHVISFYVMEKSEESSGGIGARVGVIPQIYVHVPYPGKYAEISSFIIADDKGGVNEGEDTPGSFSIRSRGEEAITGARAEVSYYSLANGGLLETVTYDDLTIPPISTITKTFTFTTAGSPPSDYRAVLRFFYGDEERNATKGFRVGSFDVELVEYQEVVERDGIVPFAAKVRNLWKGRIAADATLRVPGLEPATSARVGLVDFQQRELTVYLDTSSLPLGKNNGSLVIRAEKQVKGADNNEVAKEYPVTFTLVEAIVEVEERPGFLTGSSVLHVLLVILILLLAASVYFLVRVLKEKK